MYKKQCYTCAPAINIISISVRVRMVYAWRMTVADRCVWRRGGVEKCHPPCPKIYLNVFRKMVKIQKRVRTILSHLVWRLFVYRLGAPCTQTYTIYACVSVSFAAVHMRYSICDDVRGCFKTSITRAWVCVWYAHEWLDLNVLWLRACGSHLTPPIAYAPALVTKYRLPLPYALTVIVGSWPARLGVQGRLNANRFHTRTERAHANCVLYTSGALVSRCSMNFAWQKYAGRQAGSM